MADSPGSAGRGPVSPNHLSGPHKKTAVLQHPFCVPMWFMNNESNEPALIPFVPAELRARHDGWTAEKQLAFIEELAETACVDAACRSVGMSSTSAYRLRRRPCGAPFREAWDAALDYALHRLEAAALSRALGGVPRPVFYKGEQVGEWREYDERLTMFLLRYRRPARYGAWLDRLAVPLNEEGELTEDSAGILDWKLDEIAERAPATDGNPAADSPPAEGE